MVIDNYSLWEAHDAEQERQLAKLPVCADCDQPIQDETAYFIDGIWICEDCLEAYRRDVLEE